MKKLIIIMGVLFCIIPSVRAKENEVTIYLFRSKSCTHCEEALNYLHNHEDAIPSDIKLITYEVSIKDNSTLVSKVEEYLNTPSNDRFGVPLFVVGDEYIYGYSSYSTINKIVSLANDFKTDENYTDVIKKVLNENKELKPQAKTISDIFPEANPMVNYIVIGIFGLITIGFIGMIVFSRK